jgi:hypothetical protein
MAENTKPQQENQLNIELSEEMAEGQFCNLAFINHTNAEFIVDFINVLAGLPKAKVKSRIILTPQHAKRLASALMENVRKYEQTNGVIKESDAPQQIQLPMNFNGQTGTA